MVATSERYKGEPIRTSLLQLVLVLEIAINLVVLGVVVAAGDGMLRFPEPWHSIYQAIARSLGVWPFAAALCLLFWIFRANKNAAALSGLPLDHSPGWAVGWFFVPFANWWKPFEVMREIYKASRTPHEWRKAKRAAIVGWWWGVYLIGSVASIGIMVANSTGDTLLLRRFAVALYAAIVVHQTLLLIIVGRIVKWQATAHRAGGVENVF